MSPGDEHAMSVSEPPDEAGTLEYKWWPDVEAEIIKIKCLPQSELLRQFKEFKDETLVWIVGQIQCDQGGELAGPVLKEIGKRAIQTVTAYAHGLPYETIKDIAAPVAGEIL